MSMAIKVIAGIVRRIRKIDKFFFQMRFFIKLTSPQVMQIGITKTMVSEANRENARKYSEIINNNSANENQVC